MAVLHPSLPLAPVVHRQGLVTEMQVLERLKQALPDAYTLFHSVDWMRPQEGGTARGEIDIAVLNQAGDLLLIEVKGGEVQFTGKGIFKRYDQGVRNVASQVSLQYGSIRGRLKDLHLNVAVHQLLVLPHMRVEGESAQWPRDRIVDSDEYPDLPHHIARLLGPGVWNEQTHEAVLHFLANLFKVHLDVASVLRASEQTTSVLSAGLATWVPRVHAPEGIYRINATAGSGKTQLALTLLNAAAKEGLRAAYLCFNSPLATVMAARLHPTVQAETYHHRARLIYETLTGSKPDFSVEGVYDAMSQAAADYLARPETETDLDLLVIDEMQDMKPSWAQALLNRVKPGGRSYLFEDTDQALYDDRESFAVHGEVTITCNDNARSPQAIVRQINELRLTREPVNGLNPYVGSAAEPRVYLGEQQLRDHTMAAVQECLSLGFELKDIAVLSWRGRGSSTILSGPALGSWTLRKASGQRDEDGQEIMTAGDLLCETVYRFKGQAAGAVILTEVDMSDTEPQTSDEIRARDNAWHRLYVGMTRAYAHLAMVISEPAARAIVKRVYPDS